MNIDTLKSQERQALDDAAHWERQAQEARQNAERFEQYAANRRRDAAYYWALAEREERAINQAYAEINEAA